MFLEKNLQALAAANYDSLPVVEAILKTAAATDVEIYETEGNDLTLKYRDVFLHDPHGATREAKALVEEQCHPSPDMYHLILGMGLGYLLQTTFDATTGQILVYEPDAAFLRFALENVDLTKYLGSGRVFLMTEQYQIIQYLRPRLIFGDQLDVLPLRAYAYLMANEIPGMMENLFNLALDRRLDYNTVNRFHDQWVDQFFDNMRFFPKTLPMDRLKGLGAGKPALVVSRGPSLDAAVDDIKAMADSVVIVAVGGAVRRLHQAGVVPDFAVFYDARGMQEQLNGIPEEYWSKISFLLCPFTQDITFEHPAREKFIFFGDNNPQFAEWADGLFGKKHVRLEGGGTVSLVALQSAMLMDCNPVALVGQDLAFTNNQVYAGGIEVKTDGMGRLALEKTEELFTEVIPMTTVRGQNGEDMQTLKAFASFIRHFELIAADNNRGRLPRRLINASIGGAHIEGYELMPLSELREQIELTAWKAGHLLDAHPDICQSDEEHARQVYARGLQELEKGVKAMVQLLPALAEKAARNCNGPVNDSTYRMVRGTVFEFKREIDRHPFIRHFLLTVTLKHLRNFKNAKKAVSPESDTMKADAEFLADCLTVLRDRMLPCLEQARHRMQASMQENIEVSV